MMDCYCIESTDKMQRIKKGFSDEETFSDIFYQAG